MIEILPVVMAFFGTLGFSMYYNINIRISLINSFCSMAGYFIYVILIERTGSLFWSNFWVAVLISFFCEIVARSHKVPTTLLLVPMLFPEIPGGELYNTVWNLFVGDMAASSVHAVRLAIDIAALNLGIVLVNTVVKIYSNISARLRYGHYEGYR